MFFGSILVKFAGSAWLLGWPEQTFDGGQLLMRPFKNVCTVADAATTCSHFAGAELLKSMTILHLLHAALLEALSRVMDIY